MKAVIIGCGNIAGGYDSRSARKTVMTHAGAFALSPDVELVGAYDPDSQRTQQFCAEWGGMPAGSVSALLDDHRPDLVSICSPNETHYSIFQEVLLRRPKAILCEKPLAMSINEASAMVTAARREKIMLQVNYMRRWDPTLAAFGDRLRAGEFGRVQAGRVLYTKGIFHNASHGINLLQHWLGPVTEASWIRARDWQPQDPGGDFALRFGHANILFQWQDANQFSVFEIELLTEEARIVLPGGGAGISITRRTKSAIVPEPVLSEASETIPGTLRTVMGEVVADIVSAIRAGKELKMPAEDGLATVEVCARLRDLEKRKV